jgi:hypothetical protein
MAPRHLLSLLTAISLLAETAVAVVSQNYTSSRPNRSTMENYNMVSSYKKNLFKLMVDLEVGAINNCGFNKSKSGNPPDAIFSLTM